MGQLTKRLRKEKNISSEKKITFAGRLDPLASGLVLYLKNEKRFSREEYLALDKEYTFDVVLGVSTDSGDILGLIENLNFKTNEDVEALNESDLNEQMRSLVGKSIQKYPTFSSPNISKSDLSRSSERKLKIDKHKEIEIYSLSCLNIKRIEKDNFLTEIKEQILSIKGDFRQDLILTEWSQRSRDLRQRLFVLQCRAHVSTGTYIRLLATRIGGLFNVPALAYNIERISIGPFTIQ